MILIWMGLFWIIGINGFAAGLAAVLYLWRGQYRHRSRTLLASALTGALPASMFIAIGAMDSTLSAGMETGIGFTVAFVFALVINGLFSLPGAIIVSRKLDGGGDAFRSFE